METQVGLEIERFHAQDAEMAVNGSTVTQCRVTMDLTKNDCSRSVTMRFPDSISSKGTLTNLGGELFARIFLTGSLTSVCSVRAIFQIGKTSTKMKLVFARG